MKLFDGEYHSTLDKQGRFVMPMAVRKQMPENEECVFAVARGKDKCLYLYPMDAWQKIKEKLLQVNENDKRGRAYIMMTLGGSQIVTVDSNGRFAIPAELVKYAGLEKDIVITARLEKFVIYSKDFFSKVWEAQSMEDLDNQLGGNVLSDLGNYIKDTYGL